MRFTPAQLLKRSRGFTLIELVVVMGILTILLAITLVAINPGRQFSQANDTQRKSDVNAILNAIHQYAADNKGALPAGIPTSPAAPKTISSTVGATFVDLCAVGATLLVPTYIADLPVDPTIGVETPASSICTGNTYDTGYTVVRSAAASRITVCAVPEITPPATICVTR